ncbi:MAG: hypothetical protein ACRESS_12695 [Stenotrophobium sp.]
MMLPNSMPRRRAPILPLLVFSIGLGLTFYFGNQYYNLPKYSDADIDASTQLNLQLDLQRLGPNLAPSTPAALSLMRARLRKEITDSIQAQKSRIEQRIGIGLMALVFGFGQLVSAWLLQRHERNAK